MKRLVLIVGFLALLHGTSGVALLKAAGASMQEPSGERAGGPEETSEDPLAKWKLINTGIFALLLGFALIKLAPKFFNARSIDIQEAIREATGLKMDADFRYSEMDKKMANLSREVDKLRSQAQAQMEREHQRILAETSEEVAHIRQNSEAEVEGLRKEAERLVKRHTAELALALAERRLQAYFAEGNGTYNIRDFVDLVERSKN